MRSEEGFGFLGALGQSDGKEDGLGAAVDPQRSFVIGFLLDFHKHLPPGLVGVPMRGGLAMLLNGLVDRFQHRGDALQSASQGSGGQLDAVRGQVGDQPVAGPKEEEFVQKHLGPDGDAIAPLGNEFGCPGRGDDARVPGTLACRSVSPAADDAAVGSDIDFDRFGVLGSGEAFVGQAAAGALLLVFGQIAEIFDDGQIVVASPLRRGIAGLLAARAPAAAGGRGCLRTVFLLRLFAEELMFQLFDFRSNFLDLRLEIGFSPLAALELGLPSVFT